MNFAFQLRWPSVPFNEVVQHSAFGPRFSGELYSDSGNIATMRTTDLSPHGEISYDSMPLAQIDENKFSNHFLKQGDLVISRSGRIGTAAVFEGFRLPVLPGAFLIRFRLNETAEPSFYRYFFNSTLGRPLIMSVARGAAQQNINISNVELLKVPYPPLREQKAIVSVLSAYDDLIENNRRRITLLETAARMLYREWFVHFRFPGHEHVKIVDDLPEGWDRPMLSAICSPDDGIQTGPFGSQLHQADYSDTGVPVVMPKDMRDFRVSTATIAYIPEDLADKLGRHRMKVGDIVYGRRGDIGRRAYIGKGQDGWFCGTGCLRLRPDGGKIIPRYLFETLGSSETAAFIANQAKGSTMPNLSAGALMNVPIMRPTRQIQTHFIEAIEPMCEMAENLLEQNDKLTQARDLLLPRLMNGEISI